MVRVLAMAAFAVLLVIGCADSVQQSEETQPATAVSDTSTAAVPTSTPEVQPQTGSRLSLEDYLEVCGIGETETQVQEELPFDELAESFQAQIELLESVKPPPEVEDWHNAVLVFQMAVARTFEDYLEDPKGQSQDEFLLTTVFSLATEYQPPIDRALSDMDSDVRARLLEAGCIEEESFEAHSEQETQPGLGVSQEKVGREELPFGIALERSLDEPDERDSYEISVEAGETFFIEVSWQDLPAVKLSIFQRPGYSTIFRSELSPILEEWTADVAGSASISVSAEDGTGSYTIFISPHRPPTAEAPTPLPAPTLQPTASPTTQRHLCHLLLHRSPCRLLRPLRHLRLRHLRPPHSG